ncbi:MAG: ABC transporter ATP-binding protein [Planctomycetaceae bacterium]
MSAAVVEIDNVTKSYDDVIAVDGVSLRIDAGQTLGLIGPNGAGKTTLLRLICTLAKPDSGDVRVRGRSVRENPRAVRKALGFMPAEFGSPRNLTITEYLDYFACMYDIPRGERQRRITDVCELTDLAGRGNVMVKGLSTGNRQRLLLAKTLLHDPEVLVLDEPASGLDPRARTELRAVIRELAGMGKTILISSHILPDIEEISDRIGIIEAGRLVLDGDLESLRAHHAPTQRSVKLRVPAEQMDRAAEVLGRLAGVNSCERRDPFLVVTAEEEDCNFVLAALLEERIRIVQFADEEPSLEEIFIRSTAGKVT